MSTEYHVASENLRPLGRIGLCTCDSRATAGTIAIKIATWGFMKFQKLLHFVCFCVTWCRDDIPVATSRENRKNWEVYGLQRLRVRTPFPIVMDNISGKTSPRQTCRRHFLCVCLCRREGVRVCARVSVYVCVCAWGCSCVRELILEHYPSNKTSSCRKMYRDWGAFLRMHLWLLASDLKNHVEHTHILTCAQLPDAVLVWSPQHELGLLAPLSQE